MTAQEHLDGKFNQNCPHTKEALIMQEWVMNDMYEGLLKMPLFVLSAFGSLKDGDKLCTGDVRLELIIWLVVQSMNKCPPQFYDNDYRHEWKTAPYIPLVKQAVKSAREPPALHTNRSLHSTHQTLHQDPPLTHSAP